MAKKLKTLSLLKHIAYLRIGPSESILTFCNSVIHQLKEIRQEGIDVYEIRYDEEPGDSWLKMFDKAISEWQTGADKIEAEIEFCWLLGSNARRQGRGLPTEPRKTKAYTKTAKRYFKTMAQVKARELAERGMQEAEGPAND